MEVLDRYLRAVGSWLPKGQQADIVAELSEDLRSEIEEKERALGHRLDEADLCAILERRGHPMWVAEAYLPKRHLIGPAVLPFYWRALKIAIPCILAVFVVLYVVFAVIVKNAPPALAHPGSRGSRRILDVFLRFPSVTAPVPPAGRADYFGCRCQTPLRPSP